MTPGRSEKHCWHRARNWEVKEEKMLKRFVTQVGKPLWKAEKGITGLETAIILIAFVVVAAVFAYTVLSAGLFSTQKGQEAVYSGLKEAQSTMVIKGSVIALDDDANDLINEITFTLVMALHGEPIEFTQPNDVADSDGVSDADSTNKVVVNMVSKNWEVNNIVWTYIAIGKDDGDALLEDGEQFQITLGASADAGTGDLEDALSADTLSATEEFSIQIVPPSGATLVVERRLPAVIDDVINLN
jgi:flagellin FlaB